MISLLIPLMLFIRVWPPGPLEDVLRKHSSDLGVLGRAGI
jgi:hypothetical protein